MEINIPIPKSLELKKNLVEIKNNFLDKNFIYKNRNYYEVDKQGNEEKLIMGKNIGNGSYGTVYILGNYVCKIFEDKINRDEEIFYYEKIKANNIKGVIPIKPVTGASNAIIMPQVNGNLEDLLNNLRPNNTKKYPNDKGYDIMVFNILDNLAKTLYEASKHGLYYIDLKLPNLLYLATSPHTFEIIIGDVGSFIYFNKNNPKFEGFNANMATFPSPNSYKPSREKGFILERTRNNTNKTENHTNYLDKTLVWTLGICFLHIVLFLIFDKQTTIRLINLFNFNQVNKHEDYFINKINQINIHIREIHGNKKFLISSSILNIIKKMLNYDRQSRITIKQVIYSFAKINKNILLIQRIFRKKKQDKKIEFSCNHVMNGGYINIKGIGKRKVRSYKNGNKYVLIKGRKKRIEF